jgi:hypothetical protein
VDNPAPARLPAQTADLLGLMAATVSEGAAIAAPRLDEA